MPQMQPHWVGACSLWSTCGPPPCPVLGANVCKLQGCRLAVQGFHKRMPAGVEIGLENAGQYLGEAFGPAMKYIWAIGLLAAGVLL